MTLSFELSEFQTRRSALLDSLGGAVGLVFAGEPTSHLLDSWRPHPHFEYLTGITTESGACVLLDPTNPVEDRRIALFLRPGNPEIEKWDGFRHEICQQLRDETGFKTIYRTPMLPRFTLAAAKRAKKLACLHPVSAHTQPVSKDLEIFQKLAQRIPGCSIEDHTETLARMRAAKSPAEINMIRRALEITATAYDHALRAIKSGLNEFDIQETLEHGYRSNGSRGPLYGSIVGGGFNATVLHYRDNNQPLNDGELVCIDSAAGYNGYAADITRTFPISGTFTRRQREIYEIVLEAELAAINAVRPGAMFHEIDKAARDIIEQAGFGDFFIHGIGHHLGLEVHDITPEGPIPEGAVITIEPGIYLPDEKIGVRIEDDILVTKDGHENLSSMIPKDADEIERLMARE